MTETSLTEEAREVLGMMERMTCPPSHDELWEIAEDYSNLGKATPWPSDLDAWWPVASTTQIGIYMTNLLERTKDPGLHQQFVRLAVLCVRTVTNLIGETEQVHAEDLFSAMEDWVRGTSCPAGDALLVELRSHEGRVSTNDDDKNIEDTFPELRFIACDLAYCCCLEFDEEFHDRLPTVLDNVSILKAEKLVGHSERSNPFKEAYREHEAQLAELIRAAMPICPR